LGGSSGRARFPAFSPQCPAAGSLPCSSGVGGRSSTCSVATSTTSLAAWEKSLGHLRGFHGSDRTWPASKPIRSIKSADASPATMKSAPFKFQYPRKMRSASSRSGCATRNISLSGAKLGCPPNRGVSAKIIQPLSMRPNMAGSAKPASPKVACLSARDPSKTHSNSLALAHKHSLPNPLAPAYSLRHPQFPRYRLRNGQDSQQLVFLSSEDLSKHWGRPRELGLGAEGEDRCKDGVAYHPRYR
jgi:hypothetical protein